MAINLIGKLTVRKGTTAQRLAVILDSGELGWDITLQRLFVGDGTTPGGIPMGTILPGSLISQLNNDANFISEGQAISLLVNDVGYLVPGDNVSDLVNDANYVAEGDNVSGLVNDANYLVPGDNVSELANDANYVASGDNISELVNDAGYLTTVNADQVNFSKIGSATYGKVNDVINVMISPGIISGGVLSSLGSGVVRISAGTAIIRGTDDDRSQLYFTDFPQTDFTLPVDQDTKFFQVDYNGGNPIVTMTTDDTSDKDTQIPLGYAIRLNTSTTIVTGAQYKTGDAVVNLIQRLEALQTIVRDNLYGGLIISAGPARSVLLSAGKVWNRLTDYTHTAKDSAVNGMLTVYRNGTGLIFGGATQWDNMHFNNQNTNSLEVMMDNRYAVLWFYVTVQSGSFGFAYGTGQYTDVASAALEREPSYITTNFKLQSLFLGRMIFRKGATTPESVTSIFDRNLPIPESVSRINTFYDSTGVITGGVLSINADTAKFNISAGIASYMDFSVPGQPAQNIVEFGPFTALTPVGMAGFNATYVGINNAGQVVQQTNPFSNTQRRTIAFLGAVIHSNHLTINAFNTIAATTHAPTNQTHDLMEAIGPLNIGGGNIISANGANMNLNKSSGRLFKLGSNFQNNPSDPHVVSLGALTAFNFRYRTSTGAESADTPTILGGMYESPLGTVTAVPGANGRFTIQRVYLFQSNLIRIQYGQAWYANIDDAQAAIISEPFVTEQNISENGVLIAYILVRKNATALNDPAMARIILVPKFGGGVGGGGASMAHNNLTEIQGGTPGEYYHLTAAEYAVIPFLRRGAGDPNGVVTAPVGTMYLRSNGGAGTSLYIKESGTGNTGWVGK